MSTLTVIVAGVIIYCLRKIIGEKCQSVAGAEGSASHHQSLRAPCMCCNRIVTPLSPGDLGNSGEIINAPTPGNSGEMEGTGGENDEPPPYEDEETSSSYSQGFTYFMEVSDVLTPVDCTPKNIL